MKAHILLLESPVTATVENNTMEQRALQSPYPSSAHTDHRGRVRRFGKDIVDRKLDMAIQRLVRHEKYASALMVSFRIVHELKEPLRNLDRHIAMVESLDFRDERVQSLAVQLRRNRPAIMNAIQRLGGIEDPLEAGS